MLLFDEMEKTFSELEKVYDAMLWGWKENLNIKKVFEEAESLTIDYAIAAFLDDGSTLHSLFLRAGITKKRTMGYYLVKWMLINKRFDEYDD